MRLRDRDRAYLKRMRVDRSTASTETSDGEYYQEGEANAPRINRRNQRGVRKVRSSPEVLRAAAREMIGVVVPRRTRSSLAKRLPERLDSGYGEDLGRRRSAPVAATERLCGGFSGDFLTSSVKKKKKKMKSAVETGTRAMNGESYSKPPLMAQEDIEIEIVEALFNLKQQSQPRKLDREVAVAPKNDETRRLRKTESGGDEKSVSVQNEPSMKVSSESNVLGSIEEVTKEDRVDLVKLHDGPQEPLRSVEKEKVGSSKDSESPSCVRVNASEFQDPIMTKKNYMGTVAENGKSKMMEDDSMVSVLKKCDPIPSDDSVAFFQLHKEERAITSNQQGKPMHDALSIQNEQLQQNWKQQNQSAPSLFPMQNGLDSWSGFHPYPGYMPPLQAVLPIEGSARAPTGIQVPQFKPSQPRQRRCTTQQYIASNIRLHQQLVKEYLNAGSGSSTTLARSPKFVSGNALRATFPQGGQSFANVFGSIFPFGHNQANQPGPSSPCSASLPSNSTGKVPSPTFPSKEVSAAASYMAMLQNNGRAFPMRGGSQPPVVSFFNSSYYHHPANASQSPKQSSQITRSSSSSSHKPPQNPQQQPNTSCKSCREKQPSPFFSQVPTWKLVPKPVDSIHRFAETGQVSELKY